MHIKQAIVAAVLGLLYLAPAAAHFQLIYTPEVNLDKANDVPFMLVFWHPFENGQVMAMAAPEAFFMVHKGQRTDLIETLKPVTFTGANNSAAAYTTSVPIRRLGDYVMALIPSPYYEASEDKYIQQLTKSFINHGGVPTGWREPLGLAAEILPLNKPTNILAGSTFTGQVLSSGRPAAGVEIEIEYMAAEPDIAANQAGTPAASPMPGGAIVAISDANGMFTFGIPKAGFWGFAALGAGPETEHNGKPLSQDAVLWVRAYSIP